LYTWALRWISPVSVAVFATLTPISAVILANVILGEALTVWLILGLALVIAAIFVANVPTSVGRKGPH
ncbi:MAG: EamA family transporter, partial [Hyphomicrobiaceae bacterium]